jgi:3-oxoacyl-[acyl-carrier-protein] synthase II
MTSPARRIVITGLGAVTAAGVGVKAFWHALREGQSGLDTLTRFDPTPFTCRVAAEAREFDPRLFMRSKTAAITNRFTQFGVAVARMAHEDAGLPALPRAARFPVCFGSSTTAVSEFQGAVEQMATGGLAHLSPAVVLESIGSAVTNRIATELEMIGQTMTLASGCASGLDSIQWAGGEIQAGRAVGVLAGATDAPLSTAIYGTWSALGWLSRWPGPPSQALRPFDAMSTGTVLGEGAGAFVLEEIEHARSRGARIYAEVLGFGTGSEGLQRIPGDPTSASLEQAVRAALRAARVDPSEIDHVSSHGGGIPGNDRAETATYRQMFGRHAYSIPVTSIKPVTGNAFAASGALQIVAACLTLTEQFVPGTLNLDIADPACDLDYAPGRGRVARVRRLLVTTRAIGPTYSAVVLAPPPA